MGKFEQRWVIRNSGRPRGHTTANGVFCRGYVENEGVKLAPQVGFEPTTLRLTADTVVAASRCKHEYLDARKPDFAGNWGDSGGTLSPARLGHPWPAVPSQLTRIVARRRRCNANGNRRAFRPVLGVVHLDLQADYLPSHYSEV